MKIRITILGAGFGGLELSTRLSEEFGDQIEVTLIDKSDAFLFGFSKLDVMFGHATMESVRMPYSKFVKPGVRFLQQTVTAIDPATKRVTTDAGSHDADYLVLALGADYDMDATPGLAEANEFYSPAGAEKLRDLLPGFTRGRAVISVAVAPYKCPPAPSECALMLHDYLLQKGVRDQCEITLVVPFPIPIPPSPETSTALIAAFAERNITFIPNRRLASVDPARGVAVLDDTTELPYNLFFGVPRHCAPKVVQDSGITENGWVPVDQRSLETRFPGVFAIGDIALTKTPKAGVFAEDCARAVAKTLIGRIRGGDQSGVYSGVGACYIEFGGGRIGRVDIDFLSGPKPASTYHAPAVSLRGDKDLFGSSRRARWFGL
jgi:sulfide:quinone oxidoreductase